MKRAVDPAVGVIHAAGFAHGAESGRLGAQEKRNLKRTRLLDDVGSLVRPVAAVVHAAPQRLPADAHGDADDGAALEQPVPARVPRLDQYHGAFTRDGAGETRAAQPAHR